MRTPKEIQNKINQLVSDHIAVKAWHDKALARYQDNVKSWGREHADYGEVDYTSSEMAKIAQEIITLKWCLNI